MSWADRFEKVLNDMEAKGIEYAEAKSKSWMMQEMKGVMLASIQKRLIDEEGGLALSRAEILAKATPEYKAHIDGTAAAIHEELSLKAEYEKLSGRYESYRSLLSLDKKTGGQS